MRHLVTSPHCPSNTQLLISLQGYAESVHLLSSFPQDLIADLVGWNAGYIFGFLAHIQWSCLGQRSVRFFNLQMWSNWSWCIFSGTEIYLNFKLCKIRSHCRFQLGLFKCSCCYLIRINVRQRLKGASDVYDIASVLSASRGLTFVLRYCCLTFNF